MESRLNIDRGKLLIRTWGGPAELARPHWRRKLEQRRSLRCPLRELQQLPVERQHEHWRAVRV